MGCKYRCDLKWVGLRPSQIEGLNLPSEVMQALTPKDYAKIDSLEALFQSNESSRTGVFKSYCDELNEMRSSGFKCELEALISRSYDFSLISTLSDFIERAITQRKYI